MDLCTVCATLYMPDLSSMAFSSLPYIAGSAYLPTVSLQTVA